MSGQLNDLARWLIENDKVSPRYEDNYKEFGRLALSFAENRAKRIAHNPDQNFYVELKSEYTNRIIELIQKKEYDPQKMPFDKFLFRIERQIIARAMGKISIIKVPGTIIKLKKELAGKRIAILKKIEEKRQLLELSKGKIRKNMEDEIWDLEYQAKELEEEIIKINLEIKDIEKTSPPSKLRNPKDDGIEIQKDKEQPNTNPLKQLIDAEYLSVIKPLIQNKNYTIGFDIYGESIAKQNFPPIILREIALLDRGSHVTPHSLPWDIISFRQNALKEMHKLGVKSISKALKNVPL